MNEKIEKIYEEVQEIKTTLDNHMHGRNSPNKTLEDKVAEIQVTIDSSTLGTGSLW